jgi:hypothetical protein
VFGKVIPQTSSSHKCSVWFAFHDAVSRSWSRSLLLFLENLCHRSRHFIFRTILTKHHTIVRYGNTANKFAFNAAESKVKVTANIIKKSFVIALETLFLAQMLRNFTQVFCMVRPRTSTSFMMPHQRSLLLFLDNLCHCSRDDKICDYIYIYISHNILTRGDLYRLRYLVENKDPIYMGLVICICINCWVIILQSLYISSLRN